MIGFSKLFVRNTRKLLKPTSVPLANDSELTMTSPENSAQLRKYRRQLALSLYRGACRWLWRGKPTTVLILCHARSGSTLLNHILLSNPQIIGMGERLYNYRSEADLDVLALAARVEKRSFLRPYLYAVDQLTSSERLVDLALLQSHRLRVIFLIREPIGAVSSMLELAKDRARTNWTVHQAASYYIERLGSLALCGALLPDPSRGLFITYTDLIQRTEATLVRLQHFLHLQAAFSERYAMQPFTGVRGDSSETILRGHIVRDKNRQSVELPPLILSDLQRTYAQCQEKLAGFA